MSKCETDVQYRMHVLKPTLLLLLVIPSIAAAQTALTNRVVTDTTPNQPEHYTIRLAQFRDEPVVLKRTIFLGNSITESGRWSDLLDDSTVVNRGISGDNTFGVLNRLKEVTVRRPSKLFIMIGINDISKDIPDEIIAHNLGRILKQVREESPETEIFVQSLLPIDPEHDGFLQHFAKEHHVIRTNRLFRTVAQEWEARFINLFAVFLDPRGRMDPRFTYDGLHLGDEGYVLWADYLKSNGYVP